MLRPMKDVAVLQFLAKRFDTRTEFAGALGVSLSTLSNWEDRGISAPLRPKVWAMANDHGANLPREWLFSKAA